MNMSIPMEPMRPECPEVLPQTSEKPKAETQQDATFDLIMAELLKALMPTQQKEVLSDQKGEASDQGDEAFPQISASLLIPALSEAPVSSQPKALISRPQKEVMPDQQAETSGQGDATPSQMSANLVITTLNAVPVSISGETGPGTMPEALPLSAEQGDEVQKALTEGISVQHQALQGKDDTAITDVLTKLFKAEGKDSEGKDAPFLEAMKTESKEQRTPDLKGLPAQGDYDKSGMKVKEMVSLQETKKIMEDMAFMESTVKSSPREVGETVTMPGKDQSSDPAFALISGRAEPLQGAAGPANAVLAVRSQAALGTAHVEGHKFVITRHDGTSIEISLQPEGLGKLDIELVLDKGVVHAQVQASHAAGKELVEQNITEIMNTLAQEGIAIGGFSVSLKQGRDTGSEGMKQGYHKGNKDHASEREPAPVVHNGNQGVISIFV